MGGGHTGWGGREAFAEPPRPESTQVTVIQLWLIDYVPAASCNPGLEKRSPDSDVVCHSQHCLGYGALGLARGMPGNPAAGVATGGDRGTAKRARVGGEGGGRTAR